MGGFVLLWNTLRRDESFRHQLLAFLIKPQLSILEDFLRYMELAPLKRWRVA